jgi:lipid-binding SYLF domain-containing protein
MRPTFAMCVCTLLIATPLVAQPSGHATDARIAEAAAVLQELFGAPDRGIPKDLITSARCAIIVPSYVKAGFIVGANYGRGFAACRKGNGWTAPAGVRLEGGTFGLQAGASASDIVMLVMSEDGMEGLLSTRFRLGGEASVAAGPVGRDTRAETDPSFKAGILSWSRSRGLFAGLAIGGATLREDGEANLDLYGRTISNRRILSGEVPWPASAKRFLEVLARH